MSLRRRSSTLDEESCMVTDKPNNVESSVVAAVALSIVRKYFVAFIALIVFSAFFSLAQDTSSLCTLASAFQLFGVLGLFQSHQSLHTCTAKLVICAWAFRIATIVITKAYTPVDATGDWLHPMLEVMCLVCIIGAYVRHLIYGTSPASMDVYKEWFFTVTVIFLSLLLSSYYNLGLVGYNKYGDWQPHFVKYDVLWTAGIHIEAVAFIPQVMHMARSKQYLRQNAQFVSMSFISRAFALTFWILAMIDMLLTARAADLYTPIRLIVAAQIIQLLSISHVTFFYVRDRLRSAAEMVMSEAMCTMV